MRGCEAGQRTGRALLSVLAVVSMAARPAHGFTTDARRLAMGGVLAPGGGDLAAANVAYQSVPARRDGRGMVIPVPLGLVQLASNMPTFDPESPDFDVLRIADVALNPPFFLELRQPSPLDGDIAIGIARNELSIDFADAREVLPKEPVRVGNLWSRPLFGLGLLGARTYVAPLFEVEGHVILDDALFGVLAQGQPLLPNSRYQLDADAETMAGASFNAGWSGGGWGGTNGDGLYAGAYGKYLLGFGFARADTRFGLATADTIFGDTDPLDVNYEGTTRVSRFGRFGNGIGFDTGVAYRHGGWDVGLGLRDLAAMLRWGRTEVEHSWLDEASGEMVTETLADGEPYTQHLPTQTSLNVSWTGRRTLLAADLVTSRWGTNVHLGAERRLGRMALRGGVLTDDRSELQAAWGAGVAVSRVWLDVGFQTHALAVTGERGITLGTSIALR